jgi:hypothetical protein
MKISTQTTYTTDVHIELKGDELTEIIRKHFADQGVELGNDVRVQAECYQGTVDINDDDRDIIITGSTSMVA